MPFPRPLPPSPFFIKTPAFGGIRLSAQAQVQFFDVFVFFEFFRGSLSHDSAALDDVAVMGDLQGQLGVLFDQQDGESIAGPPGG